MVRAKYRYVVVVLMPASTAGSAGSRAAATNDGDGFMSLSSSSSSSSSSLRVHKRRKLSSGTSDNGDAAVDLTSTTTMGAWRDGAAAQLTMSSKQWTRVARLLYARVIDALKTANGVHALSLAADDVAVRFVCRHTRLCVVRAPRAASDAVIAAIAATTNLLTVDPTKPVASIASSR
jgi:predicted nucleic acid-binding protein